MNKKERNKFLKVSLGIAATCLCGGFVCGGAFEYKPTLDTVQAQTIEQAFEERSVDYFTTYAVGETISVHNLSTIVDGQKTTFSVALVKGSSVFVTLNKTENQKNYVFTEKGKYTLNYYLEKENSVKELVKSFSITVNDQPYFDIAFNSRYMTNTEVAIQSLCKYATENVQANVQVTSPSGDKYMSTMETLKLNENGIWEIKYVAEISGISFVRTYTLFVEGKAVTYDEYIMPLSGVGSIVADMETPEYAKDTKGIGVVLNSNSGSFRFNNTINLNSLTKEDNLFNILPLDGGDYQYMKTMSIKLIDAYDSDNYLTLHLNQRGSSTLMLDQIYVTHEYKGVTYSLDDNGGIRLDWYYGVGSDVTFRSDWLKIGTERTALFYLYDQYYQYRNDPPESENYKKYLELKEYADYWMYRGDAFYGSADGFTPRYDANEKMFYVWNEPSQKLLPLVDMDNPTHVGFGNEWKGFTTGEVYVEVDMTIQGNSGGCMVLEMGGETMVSGDSTQRGSSLFFDLEENGLLPVGIVGKEYTFPKVSYSVDVIDGKVILPEYSIIKLEKEIIEGIRYSEIELPSTKSFIPTEASVYRVTYKIEDSNGNSTLRQMRIPIQATLGQKSVEIEDLENLYVGETFVVPNVEVKGLSTILKRNVSILYNGVEYADKAEELVFLNKAGNIVIECSFEDYLGQTLTYSQTVPVSIKDEPIVTMQSVLPKYVIKNRSIVLPNISALNYAKEGTDGFEAVWSLTVDGKSVDINKREVLVSKKHGEKVRVVYTVEGTEPIVGEMTVVEAKYLGDRFFAYEGSIDVNDTENYTALKLNSDAKVDFINPFIIDSNTSSIPFAFDIPKDQANFESVDVYFEDYLDSTDSIFFRITYKADGLYAQLNGQGGTFALLKNKNGSYGFSYTASSKTFTFANKLLVETTFTGERFEGFTSNRVNVRFEFNEVKSASEFHVYTLSVVNFNSFFEGNTLLEYRDTLTPVLVSKKSYLENSFKYGSVAVIPAIEARTLLSGGVSATLTVISPSGKMILNQVNGYNDYSILLEEYGTYKISYKVPFMHTFKTFNYTFRVYKEKPHEVSFGNDLKKEYSLGNEITVPTVSVTGALGEYKIEYVLIGPDFTMKVVDLGDKILLDKLGTYVLNVTVTDKHNIVSTTWTFQVK